MAVSRSDDTCPSGDIASKEARLAFRQKSNYVMTQTGKADV
jgi:hypothetical protein